MRRRGGRASRRERHGRVSERTRPNGAHVAARISAAAAVLWLLFATFPGAYLPLHTGVDGSAIYGLNYLIRSDLVFGRDVAFAFGPLGYLLFPLNIGPNLVHGVVFRLLIHAVFAGVLAWYALGAGRVVAIGFFSLAYLLAMVVGLGGEYQYEYHLVVVVGLLSGAALLDRRVWHVTAPLRGALPAVFLFLKLSLGVASLSVVILGELIGVVRRGEERRLVLALLVGSYTLTIAVLALTFFGSFGGFWQWLRHSLELADAYSVAMSLVGPWNIVVLGVLSLAVYAGLVGLLVARRSAAWPAGVVFAGAVALALKHGFVRQDGHVMFFFAFLLGVISVVILNSDRAEDLQLALSAFLVTLVLALPPAVTYGSLSHWAADLVLGTRGWSHVRAAWHLEEAGRDLDERGRANVEASRLPPDWVATMRRVEGTVDVVPWELTYCPANNLRCRPSRVLQTYSAYTASRDRWNADHYTGPQRPTFLIVDFLDFDERHPMLSTPATFRAILDHYVEIERDESRALLLLRAGPGPGDSVLRVAGRRDARVGEWVSVPRTDGPLFAEVGLELDVTGKVMKSLFRVPPVRIDLLFQSGRRASYRIYPDTAKNGLLVNYLPETAAELAGLLRGMMEDRVVKFRISGPGAAYFRDAMPVTWKESTKSVRFTGRDIDVGALSLVRESTLSFIDFVNGMRVRPGESRVVVDGSREMVTITGWAIDVPSRAEAGGVVVTVDGEWDIPAVYGLERRDVAEYLQNDRYGRSGFSASVSTAALGRGYHTLSLKVVTADKRGFYAPPAKLTLEVGGGRGAEE